MASDFLHIKTCATGGGGGIKRSKEPKYTRIFFFKTLERSEKGSHIHPYKIGDHDSCSLHCILIQVVVQVQLLEILRPSNNGHSKLIHQTLPQYMSMHAFYIESKFHLFLLASYQRAGLILTAETMVLV